MLSLASFVIVTLAAAACVSLSAQARSSDDSRDRKFIADHEARIRPLEKAVNLA